MTRIIKITGQGTFWRGQTSRGVLRKQLNFGANLGDSNQLQQLNETRVAEEAENDKTWTHSNFQNFCILVCIDTLSRKRTIFIHSSISISVE